MYVYTPCSKVQYIYIHDAINDHIACGDTAIVANKLGQMIAEMNKSDPGVQNTALEEQYYVSGIY